MTTSHRPQLEARSGAKSAAYTPTSIEHARLLPGHTKLKFRKTKQDGKSKESSAQDERSGDEYSEEAEVDEGEQYAIGKEDLKVKKSENDQNSSAQELPNIQDAQMENRIRLEQNGQAKQQIPSRRSWRESAAFGHHKISKKTKIKEDSTKKPISGYVNDMTKSEYHHEFLHKHVR
ncbi:Cwc15p [Saccharomyces cerevisiae x Saccharomyces kudriavzevii VIN7]|uniref:Pre-mRNA-splicing factor CWC15 n=1 Tax=Saccharomyces cerevisiae x Saccharomyces kudriavzevii (strain VIN7) TaxID=1095631 RepID=H0GST9_SACCK|nr:Cwc15p [Saccharomyces cerevisiae x Saccharomyces kudriavzevii VIN7]